MSCNGILTKSESVCYSCGEKVADGGAHAAKAKSIGFNTLVSIVFYISLAMIGVSIFTSFGPPLSLCVPVTLVLLFVKSSADQQKKNQT